MQNLGQMEAIMRIAEKCSLLVQQAAIYATRTQPTEDYLN